MKKGYLEKSYNFVHLEQEEKEDLEIRVTTELREEVNNMESVEREEWRRKK